MRESRQAFITFLRVDAMTLVRGDRVDVMMLGRGDRGDVMMLVMANREDVTTLDRTSREDVTTLARATIGDRLTLSTFGTFVRPKQHHVNFIVANHGLKYWKQVTAHVHTAINAIE